MFFLRKNPKITILIWVLVFGFMNLVSVDAKERSKAALQICDCRFPQ